MSNHKYIKSTNPFDQDYDEDIDDDAFLKNSRRTQRSSSSDFNVQVQNFQERKRQIEERTIQSSEQSLRILQDSEQIGIATAEELARQREKLEKTDRNLDDINNTLISSQKHINGIKSVFSSLKNYMSGKSDKSFTAPQKSIPSTVRESSSSTNLNDTLQSVNRYEVHPNTRLKDNHYDQSSSQQFQPTNSDFNSKLDKNLHELCDNITRLKGLASNLGEEIDHQNDLIDRITDKADQADLRIQQQNKQMFKILKK